MEINGVRRHPEGLKESQEKLFLQLFEIEAIKFGSFKLNLHEKHPEAPLSPVYVAIRKTKRFPEIKKAIVDAYEDLVHPLEYDLLADVPTAGTFLISSLQDRLKIGMVTPRVNVKTHGPGDRIEGMLPQDRGKIALPGDDVITSGESFLKTIEILREEGLRVVDVIALIDREQGGKNKLEAGGLRVHVSLTMTQMLNFYLRIGVISNEVFQETKRKLDVLNAFMRVHGLG